MGRRLRVLSVTNEVALQAGDMVILPHGDTHEMWHGEISWLFPGTRLLPTLAKGELATEEWGGDGPAIRIICGYLGSKRHAEGLFLPMIWTTFASLK